MSRAIHAQRAAPATTVALCPMGRFPDALLDEIDRGLRAELRVAVLRLRPVSLPPAAWYAPRRRYRAERLLDDLHRRLAPPATRILGVTEVDISTTAHDVYDWGVLGLGDLGGTACVISTLRCRRTARDAAQASFRMVTTCVHEVGHTLGLEHCPDPACLMTDARGSVRTVDRTSGHLCARCRRRVGLT
jgi:archaemetzincin